MKTWHNTKSSLEAGRGYPRTYREFVECFPNNESCIAYLEKLRWPNGFICPGCDSVSEPWYQTRGRLLRTFLCRARTGLQAYANCEFLVYARDYSAQKICNRICQNTFRFNRRTFCRHGRVFKILLEQAVVTGSIIEPEIAYGFNWQQRII
jgi:Transposase zinc-ribbon domain